jgi:hypothetical protein
VRWIVLLITTVSLLGGACTSSDARRRDLASSVTQTKSLPAASALARRTGSVPELRLPTFTLPAAADAATPRVAAVAPASVEQRGGHRVRTSRVFARGPPRG